MTSTWTRRSFPYTTRRLATVVVVAVLATTLALASLSEAAVQLRDPRPSRDTDERNRFTLPRAQIGGWTSASSVDAEWFTGPRAFQPSELTINVSGRPLPEIGAIAIDPPSSGGDIIGLLPAGGVAFEYQWAPLSPGALGLAATFPVRSGTFTRIHSYFNGTGILLLLNRTITNGLINGAFNGTLAAGTEAFAFFSANVASLATADRLGVDLTAGSTFSVVFYDENFHALGGWHGTTAINAALPWGTTGMVLGVLTTSQSGDIRLTLFPAEGPGGPPTAALIVAALALGVVAAIAWRGTARGLEWLRGKAGPPQAGRKG